MGKRLKFILSERLETFHTQLATKILPYLQLEWDEHRKFDEGTQTEKREYHTSIDNIKVIVKEEGVSFTVINRHDPEGKFEQTRLLEDNLPDGKKAKSLIYKMLVERFDKSDEILFYQGLTKSLQEHVVVDEDTIKQREKDAAARQKELL